MFCVVLLIKEQCKIIVILANVYNKLIICLCCTYGDLIYGDTNSLIKFYDELCVKRTFQVEELRVINKDQEGQTLKLGDVTPRLTLHISSKYKDSSLGMPKAPHSNHLDNK